MTTPKPSTPPTPTAMEVARKVYSAPRCGETSHDTPGVLELFCPECAPNPGAVAAFAAIIQTHACSPAYREGQIAGLEWVRLHIGRVWNRL